MNNKTSKLAFHIFPNEASFEKWLRTIYHNKWKNKFIDYKKSLDCIAVNKILFTMEEYDIRGQVLTWRNIRTGAVLNVSTINRYKNGYKDAIVELMTDGDGLLPRFDPSSYAD